MVSNQLPPPAPPERVVGPGKGTWVLVQRCTACKVRMSEYDVMYSHGVCPRCGHDSHSTICNTTRIPTFIPDVPKGSFLDVSGIRSRRLGRRKSSEKSEAPIPRVWPAWVVRVKGEAKRIFVSLFYKRG